MKQPSKALLDAVHACLAARPEVLEAYVFGSQARGDTHAHSDVDVAVFLDPAHPPTEGFGPDADLAADLMGALHRTDIEVVVLNGAGPMLYHRVLRDGVRVLSRDLRATTTREGYAMSRYADWVPYWRKVEAALKARHPTGGPTR